MNVNMQRREFIAGAGAALLSGCSFPRGNSTRKIRFASWNIGHFSLGLSSRTTLRPEEADAKGRSYRDFLGEVDADVIGICEYYDSLTTAENADVPTSVFSRYDGAHVGPRHEWQWNATYWRGAKVLERRFVDFPLRVQRTYFLLTRLEFGGVDVMFAQTHLDWGTIYEGHEGDRADQMLQLIKGLSSEPRVVIAGDFNIGIRSADRTKKTIDNPVEYKVFEDAGYVLGNDGRYKTYPAGCLDDLEGACALDNIIVRGLDLRSFQVVARPDLSDHALVCATLAL